MQWVGVAVVLIPRAGTVTGIVSIESSNMAWTKMDTIMPSGSCNKSLVGCGQHGETGADTGSPESGGGGVGG